MHNKFDSNRIIIEYSHGNVRAASLQNAVRFDGESFWDLLFKERTENAGSSNKLTRFIDSIILDGLINLEHILRQAGGERISLLDMELNKLPTSVEQEFMRKFFNAEKVEIHKLDIEKLAVEIGKAANAAKIKRPTMDTFMDFAYLIDLDLLDAEMWAFYVSGSVRGGLRHVPLNIAGEDASGKVKAVQVRFNFDGSRVAGDVAKELQYDEETDTFTL